VPGTNTPTGNHELSEEFQMKVMSGATARTVSGAARGAIREWIDDGSSTAKQTGKQARESIEDARKQARRQVTRARIAAARARAETRVRAGGVSRKAVGAAGAVGLAAGYFLDPDSGKRRRNVARDRALALIRRGADRTRSQAEYRADQVEGKVEAAKSKAAPEKPGANDQALADRVKSEIFQPADAPKGSVNVNVEDGVVYLRGEVKKPEQIRKLVKDVEKVDGVSGVENLLHTP
jgi:osmotically-inducible protein OsmY